MAFFSLDYAHDTQTLRRKRSTSNSRPSPGNRSADESSLRSKRSPSVSSSPSGVTPDPHEPTPPLPTPVSAGIPRPRTFAPADQPASSPSPYEQSSTPIPFTKPTKRTSPPPFSSLLIDVPGLQASDPGRGSHPPITSKSASARGSRAPKNIARSTSSGAPAPRDPSPSASNKVPADVEPRPPPFSPPALFHMPPTTIPVPPSSKTLAPTATLPTPVSPRRLRNEPPSPLATPPRHSHSHSQSQTPPATASASATSFAKLSTRPPRDREPSPSTRSTPPSGSASTSASGSGNSTPTHDPGKQQREKRPRNVLRKASVSHSNRSREPASAPASDGERKAERKSKTHRPRARSGVFASLSRRDSTGTVFEVVAPRPATAGTPRILTPAGEVLVAYKESLRDGSPRATSFGSSGKVVAVGTPEDDALGNMKSPWTAGWRRSLQSHDERSVDEQEPGGKRAQGLRRSLSRKLSERWGTKTGERPREDLSRRSASGGDVEFSHTKTRVEGKRSATFPKDPRFAMSPTSGGTVNAKQRSGWPMPKDEGEGRVWEEDIGDWYSSARAKDDPDALNTSRLWKLVRKFSSGTLKEKHSPPLEPPPPVPPLPNEITRVRAGAGVEMDADAGEMPIPQTAVPQTPGGIMRYITSMPSLSVPRPSLAAAHMSAHRRPDLGSGASADASRRTSAQARRSTTTRSSSPSSENTKFFARSRSSSTSSYGEELVPPMPHAQVGKHIVPPHELYRMHNTKGEDEDATARSSSSGSSTIHKPIAPPSLTPSSSTHTPQERSPATSATIPFFEAKNPSNRFSPYKGKQSADFPSPPTTHFPDAEPLTPRAEQPGGLHPPPAIPKRDPRRTGHATVSAPSLPLPLRQHSISGVILVQDSSESEATDADTPRPQRRPSFGRRLIGGKARPRSISDGAVPTESSTRKPPTTAASTLTFREMTATQRHLTEQEKNDKWEDLLQRSDMAGGTLHVGSPTAGGLTLWSDRSSMALSDTLDRF